VDGGSRFWLAVRLRFCHVVDSDVAAASCVKRRREGESYCSPGHCRSFIVGCQSPVATWPLLLVIKETSRGVIAHLS
jgi:hypothetical protein